MDTLCKTCNKKVNCKNKEKYEDYLIKNNIAVVCSEYNKSLKFTVKIRIDNDYIRTEYITASSKKECLNIILNQLTESYREITTLNIGITEGSVY